MTRTLTGSYPQSFRPGEKKPNVLVSRVGLHIPPGLSFDSWQQAGQRVVDLLNSSSWCLGDWILYGQHRYSERYRMAVEAAGLDYKTVRNYAWVARRFELSRRRVSLSFQHHAEVASLPTAAQDDWLDRAETGSWSRNQLREAIRATRPGEGDQSQQVPLPKIYAESTRLESWRAAAERSARSLEAWIVSCLDSEAAVVLHANGGHD